MEVSEGLERNEALNVLRLVYDSVNLIRGTNRAIVTSGESIGVVNTVSGDTILDLEYSRYEQYGKVVALGTSTLDTIYIAHDDTIVELKPERISHTNTVQHTQCFYTPNNRVICINGKSGSIIKDTTFTIQDPYERNTVYWDNSTGELVHKPGDKEPGQLIKDDIILGYSTDNEKYQVLFESGKELPVLDYLHSIYDQVYRIINVSVSCSDPCYMVVQGDNMWYTNICGKALKTQGKQVNEERINQLKQELALIEV